MKKTYFIISLVLVIVWMVVIFFLSEMPSYESNLGSKKIANKIIEETMETSSQVANGDGQSNITKTKKNKSNETLEELNYIIRKISHACVYLVLSILVLNLFAQVKSKLSLIHIIIAILFCFIYACTDEFHQTFVTGRTGQFMDVGIDTIGAFVGVICFYLFHKLLNLRKGEAISV